MGSRRTKRRDRARPRRNRGRRGRRVDISRGVRLGWGRDPGLDPPHRSLSEGRGLPYTRLIRAMLPFTAVAIGAMFAFIAVVVAVIALLG
jgi:hypothetical protein